MAVTGPTGNQTIVKRVSGDVERKALASVLKTVMVDEIAIPKEKLALFPPRAIGYGRSRESFKSKLGVAQSKVSMDHNKVGMAQSRVGVHLVANSYAAFPK